MKISSAAVFTEFLKPSSKKILEQLNCGEYPDVFLLVIPEKDTGLFCIYSGKALGFSAVRDSAFVICGAAEDRESAKELVSSILHAAAAAGKPLTREFFLSFFS